MRWLRRHVRWEVLTASDRVLLIIHLPGGRTFTGRLTVDVARDMAEQLQIAARRIDG
jgi:hypothetical protein